MFRIVRLKVVLVEFTVCKYKREKRKLFSLFIIICVQRTYTTHCSSYFYRYFNKEGKPVDYKPLLRNTSRNCGGGLTPWNTWISCEEVRGGQCWQVDPNPNGVHHKNPKETLLGGGNGGKYETVVRSC